MARIVIGSIVAGLIQFIVGAIAWVSPLGELAFGPNLPGPVAADLQAALAKGLASSGTYFVPSPETPEGIAMLAKGPAALIMFDAHGSAPFDPGSLLVGLLLSIGMMLLVALALRAVPVASRMQVMLLFAIATIVYFVVSLPVYNFYMPWSWWLFLAAQEFVGFVLGALVLIRWFLPTPQLPTPPSART